MHKYLLDFLQELEKAVAPNPGGHHAITFAEYGNDKEGFKPRLALQLSTAKGLQTMFLDEADFNLPIDELVQLLILCDGCGHPRASHCTVFKHRSVGISTMPTELSCITCGCPAFVSNGEAKSQELKAKS